MRDYDIIDFIMTQLFKEVNEIKQANLVQLHCAIDLLVDANIPFSLSFNQRTATQVQSFTLTVTINPLVSLTIGLQMEENSG